MNKPYWLIIYVCILHLGPFLNICGLLPGGRVYVVTTVANLIGAFFTINYFGRAARAQGRSFTILDMLVTAHLVWSILSIVLYFQQNSPTALEGYFHGIQDFALPIFAYFIAKHLTLGQLMKAMRYIVLLNAGAMLFGIYLYYLRPDFYTVYLLQSFNREGELEMWQLYGRMQSYLGSTAVGIVSALSIVMIRLINPPVILALSGVALFGTSVLLSQQRGGMVAAILALLYFLIFKKGRRIASFVAVGAGLILSLWVLGTVDEEHGGVIDSILNRTAEAGTVFEVRSGYTVVLDYIIEFPFGVGIGATGASSDGLQDRSKVVDANFMRILADLGMQGLALFVFLLFTAGFSALKRKDGMGWLTILAAYVVVALGTNTLDSHYVSQLFWVLLACMDTPEEQNSIIAKVNAVEVVERSESPALGPV